MLSDELTHLEIVINKKPIIATWQSQDLIERPETVRENYLSHIRSFVVMNRLSAESDEGASVEQFEKRLIKLVKDGGAGKGYITAEYGYGKTSTALFIWNRCEQSNIVAVPPFQIQHLHHLISATYGWVRYKLSLHYPGLIPQAEELYQRYINRDFETHAHNEIERAAYRRAYDEGRYTLDLRPLDYIKFFEEMTALVKRANFDGLVIIADELQQYIDPEIKAGTRDPITPLFDIIQALITRKGQLPFALLFSVPTKELGLINDQRGDLVQRLKSDRLYLDLGAVYNQSFARQLWEQLAHELEFESLKDRIVQPATLDALGQISARPDLATGPRTVIDAFNLMVRRFKSQPDHAKPFTPQDLIDAFLNNEISYDNTSKLQQVINTLFMRNFIIGKPQYQRAIKLMAAFPIDGLSETNMALYEVTEAINHLTQEAQGDIIIFKGGGVDENGRHRETRAGLLDLEIRETDTGWLAKTLREFRQNYVENSPRMRDLVVKGFTQLLRQEVFKQNNWKQQSFTELSMSQNRAMILEGAFGMTVKRFPNRKLDVKIIGLKEKLLNNSLEGDLILNFQLQLNDDQPEQQRRYLEGGISYPQSRVTTFTLNLNHNSGKQNFSNLNNTLIPLFSPMSVTPALLLTIYAYLDEKLAAKVVPLEDEAIVRDSVLPTLREHTLNELFNPEMGASLQAAGTRIVEETVRRQLEQNFSQYKTLMITPQWRQNLLEYRTVLGQLPSVLERNGSQPFDKGSQELAKLFAKAVPAMETFISNHSLLIQHIGSNYKFLLHPLEDQVLRQIKESLLPPKAPDRPGGKPRKYIKWSKAWEVASQAGYREEELVEIVKLLEARGLLTVGNNRTELIEEIPRVVTVDELEGVLETYAKRLALVKAALPDNQQLTSWNTQVESARAVLKLLKVNRNEGQQNSLASTFKVRQADLDSVIENERNHLLNDFGRMIKEVNKLSFSFRGLEQPVERVLFGQQLEAQRQALLKICTEMSGTVEPLKARLLAAIQLTGEMPLSAENLGNLVQEHKGLIKTNAQVQEHHARLNETVTDFDKAKSVLAEGITQEQRLRNMRADMVEEYSPRLQEWAFGAIAELSSRKIEALANYHNWQADLQKISREIENRLGKEAEFFADKQASYKSYLTRAFPQVKAWVDVRYNQTEPQDSYNRLWQGVHEIFKQAVENIRQQVQGVYDRAARLQGGSLSILPSQERQQVQEWLNQLMSKLTHDRETTAKWVTQVNAENFIKPIIEKGPSSAPDLLLKNVLGHINKLNENLPQYIEGISKVEQEIEKVKPTAEEARVLAKLNELIEAGMPEGVELGLLLSTLANKDDSWVLFRSLYNKTRLIIKISPKEMD